MFVFHSGLTGSIGLTNEPVKRLFRCPSSYKIIVEMYKSTYITKTTSMQPGDACRIFASRQVIGTYIMKSIGKVICVV